MTRSFWIAALAFTAGCVGARSPGDHESSVAAAQSGVEAVPGCVSATPPQIRPGAVGGVRVGQRVEALKASCSVVADSSELGDEAIPERILYVAMGPDTLRTVVEDGTVWRIEVASRNLRTVDSLGVGSTVRDLLARGDTEVLEGEGRLYLVPRRACGLSFRLSYAPTAEELASSDSFPTSRIPAGSRVDRVLVTECADS